MNLALAQAESQDFYQPPTTLPAGEGTMIKSEPTPLLGQIPGIPGTWPGNGEKIMYTSTLVDGTSRGHHGRSHHAGVSLARAR